MRGERWPRRPEPALPRGTPTHGSGAGAGAGDRASSSHPHSAEPAPVPTGVPFVPGRGAGATGLRSDGRDQHTQGWGAPPATPVHTGRGRAGGSRNSPRGSCAGGTPASCSPPPARPGASHTRVSHTGPQGPTRTRQAAGGPGPRGERPSPRRPPPAATGTASVLPQPAASRVHWASARSMPCNGSAPGSPLPQDLASSAPCCMAGAPTGRGGRGPEWGGGLGLLGRPAGPAQDPPPGCEAPGRRHCCTHLEEAHGAVTAVRDAGHLHAPPAALPVQRPVLKALWGRGGVRPEAWPALLGARHGRGGGCSPRGSRCCRSGSHS